MAETIVRTKGRPDLRVVEIDHPLGGISPDDLELRVTAATDLVLRFLEAGE